MGMRVRVYVDGFNLHYGAVRGTPFKWLNLVDLARELFWCDAVVGGVRYFTARIAGNPDSRAPGRQQAYLSALGALPEVTIHMGRFSAKRDWRPLTNLPVAGKTIHAPAPSVSPAGDHVVRAPDEQRGRTLRVGGHPRRGARGKPNRTALPPDALVAEFQTREEKASDVNLAAYLLDDLWNDRFDEAVVISNDTDLVTPIGMVAERKPITVACPGRLPAALPSREVATRIRYIHRAQLRRCQLPSPIPGTSITRPDAWK